MRFILLFSLLVALASCGDKSTDNISPVNTWDSKARWSATGSKILYYHRGAPGGSPSGIYVVDTATLESTLAAQSGSASADWLDGDTSLVYLSGGIHRKVLTTGADSLLYASDMMLDYGLEATPDGRSVYFCHRDSSSSELHRYDVMSNSAEELSMGRLPRLSPDGRFLAMVNEYFIIVNMENAVRFFYTTGTTLYSYEWYTDSRRLVIELLNPETGKPAIYLHDFNESQTRFLASGKSPTVSPDGSRIAFSRNSADQHEHIWLMDTLGGSQKQVTF